MLFFVKVIIILLLYVDCCWWIIIKFLLKILVLIILFLEICNMNIWFVLVIILVGSGKCFFMFLIVVIGKLVVIFLIIGIWIIDCVFVFIWFLFKILIVCGFVGLCRMYFFFFNCDKCLCIVELEVRLIVWLILCMEGGYFFFCIFSLIKLRMFCWCFVNFFMFFNILFFFIFFINKYNMWKNIL